jgi:uncharacterized repeat protein (TIGR01451 family)
MSTTVAPYRVLLAWLTVIGCLALSTGWLLPRTTYTVAKGLTQAPTSIDLCSNKTILFVGGSRPLPLSDQPLAAYLTTLGHTVIVLAAHEVKMPDVKDKDLVIISESVEPEEIKNNLDHVDAPLLTWEGWLFDDFYLTGPIVEQDYGELTSETSIRVTNPTHPLAAGLSGDVPTTKVNDQTSPKFYWGVPSQDAIIIATALTNGNRAHIFAYEQGTQMVGRTAPARRVGLHNATGTDLTPEGWLLFVAAVQWALNCPSDATPEPTVSEPTATTIDTPTSTPTSILTATLIPGTTPTLTSTDTPMDTPSPTATFVPETTPTPMSTDVVGQAQLSLSNTDFLFADADGDDHISAGDSLLYALAIHNTGDGAALQVRIEDDPDPNTTLRTGSVRTNQGVVVEGNTPGDERVVIVLDRLEGGARATMSLQVTINQPLGVATLQNQARAMFSASGSPGGQTSVMSDDPDTQTPFDATLTEIDASLVQTAKLFLPLVQSAGNGLFIERIR